MRMRSVSMCALRRDVVCVFVLFICMHKHTGGEKKRHRANMDKACRCVFRFLLKNQVFTLAFSTNDKYIFRYAAQSVCVDIVTRLRFRLFCILFVALCNRRYDLKYSLMGLVSFNWKQLHISAHLQLWLIIIVLIVCMMEASTSDNNNIAATAIRTHSYFIFRLLEAYFDVTFFFRSFCISSFTTFNLSEMKNHDVTHSLTQTICNRHIIIVRILLFFLFVEKRSNSKAGEGGREQNKTVA